MKSNAKKIFITCQSVSQIKKFFLVKHLDPLSPATPLKGLEAEAALVQKSTSQHLIIVSGWSGDRDEWHHVVASVGVGWHVVIHQNRRNHRGSSCLGLFMITTVNMIILVTRIIVIFDDHDLHHHENHHGWGKVTIEIIMKHLDPVW